MEIPLLSIRQLRQIFGRLNIQLTFIVGDFAILFVILLKLNLII